MTVGRPTATSARPRAAFGRRAPVADELGLPTCSMGMTDDLEVALAAGTHPGPRRHGAVRPAPATRDGARSAAVVAACG